MVAENKKKFKIIGCSNPRGKIFVWFLVDEGRSIISVEAGLLTKRNIKKLHNDESWWLSEYLLPDSSDNSSSLKTKHCQAIQCKLLKEAYKSPLYDKTEIRTNGVWLLPTKQIAIHFGDCVGIWDFTKEPIIKDTIDVDDFIFIKQPAAFGIDMHNALSPKDAEKIVDLFRRWDLGGDVVAELMAGFIFTSNVSSILPYRPHVWINTNMTPWKTSFVDGIVKPLTTGVSLSANDKTPRKIRDETAYKSGILIDDELENSSEGIPRRKLRFGEIISYSEGGSAPQVIKANPDGESVDCYEYQVSLLVLSERGIYPLLQGKSNIMQIDVKPNKNPLHSLSFDNILNDCRRVITPDVARKFKGRSIRQYKTLEKNFHTARNVIDKETENFRVRDLYSIMLAGYFALIQDDAVTSERISDYVANKMANILHN